jgi:hypothetical protein
MSTLSGYRNAGGNVKSLTYGRRRKKTRDFTMKILLLLTLLIPNYSFADGSDYWSKDKNINLPSGIGTTTCGFYNNLDKSDETTEALNELFRTWMTGWVSSFATYSDWNIRNIEESEYIEFLQEYCKAFPQYTISRAAHTFTYRVKIAH